MPHASLRRVFLSILVFFIAAQASAQSCPQPVIDAPAEMCSSTWGTTASIHPPAEGSWTSVSWTIANGYFLNQYGGQTNWAQGETVTFVAATSVSPVTLGVSASHSSGCSTNSVQRQVVLRDIDPMVITATDMSCGGPVTAVVQPPAAGSWSGVWWSISSNAYFIDQYGNRVSSASGESVRFVPITTDPVTLTTYARDSAGCESHGSAVVPFEELDPLVIDAPPTSCGGRTTASVQPATRGTWNGVWWTISDNGHFVDQYGYPSDWASGETVQFVAETTSPVTLYASALDSYGCQPPSATKVVTFEEIAAPVINAPADVCPNAPATASVADRPGDDQWNGVWWTITNGQFVNEYGMSSWAQGQTVQFVATSALPVTLDASGLTNSGCSSPHAAAQVAIRTLEPPVITVDHTEICPNGEATASVPAEYQDYSWTIANGSFLSPINNPMVEFRANGNGPVLLSVWVRGDDMCEATSVEKSVPLKVIAPPVVTVDRTEICPNGEATASVPAEYMDYSWSITNGSFLSPSNGPMVEFRANGNGPVLLTVWVRSEEMCEATSVEKSVPIKVIAPPVVTVDRTEICPNGQGTASVPAEYMDYNWSIANGSFLSPSNNPMVEFRANGNGPVLLTVWVRSEEMCEATSTEKSVPIKVIAPPVVTVDRTEICPNGQGTASVPAEYMDYNWTIANGSFISPNNSPMVVFHADGNGPVLLKVWVRSEEMCEATSTETSVPIKTIAMPVMTVDRTEICPNGEGTASVPAEYQDYAWSIVNGSFLSPNNSPMVTFRANYDGPVVLTVWVRSEEMCEALNSRILLVKTIEPPVIAFDRTEICPNGTGTASVPAEYIDYNWTIANGTFTSPSTGPMVTFLADGSAPVVLRVWVRSEDMCEAASDEKSLPLKTIPPPVITVDRPEICPTGEGTASVPAEYLDYNWTVTNGALTSPSTGPMVTFSADGEGPVLLSVWVRSEEMCEATSVEKSVPLKTIEPPVVTFDRPEVCPEGEATASVPDQYVTYYWSIFHGSFTSPTTGAMVTFRPDGSGPVELLVDVRDAGGCRVSSEWKSIPFKSIEPPVITFDRPEVCPEGEATASVPAQYSTYYWSIFHGSITSPTTGAMVTFRPDGTGPVELIVDVRDAENCRVFSEWKSIPLKSIEPPVITFDRPEVCPEGEATASVPAQYSTYYWSIFHGSITSPTTDAMVTFRPDGTGPVELIVDVRDAENCRVFSEWKSIPLKSIEPPVITFDRPEVCPNGEATASVPDQYSTYFWGISGGTFTSPNTGAMVSFRADGSGPVQLIVDVRDAENCRVFAGWQSIPLKTFAPATITAPEAVCANATAAASVNDYGPTATYAWTATNATITGGQGTATITFLAGATGPVELSVAIADGACTAGASKTIAVNDTPEFELHVSETGTSNLQSNGVHEFCGVSQVGLTASVLDPTWTYTWSTGANGPHLAVSESGTYTLTATNASGCSYSQSETVVIHPATVASISGNLTLCPGGATTLTASGGDSYVWSTGATTPSISVTSAGTYTVTATSANGCSNATSATVVEAASVITAEGPTTFCYGNSVTLTAAQADSYLWSTSETTRSIVVSASGTYTVRSTFGSCELDSAPVAVSVGPSSVSVSVDDASLCPGQSVTFTASVTGGGNVTYQWFDPVNDVVYDGATGPAFTFTPTQPGYGYAAVRVTDANGCTLTSNQVQFIRFDTPKPEITAIGGLEFCEGGSVMLEASDAASEYLWSNGATTRSIVVTTPGTYTVTATYGGGCARTSDPVAVTELSAPPQPAISADGPLTFCEGGSVTLTAPVGFSYLWSNGATTQSIAVNASGSYSVTVTNASGCSATSAATNVTVNAAPATPAITPSGATTFCEGGSVTLTAPAGFFYLWSNGATTQSIAVNASGSYSVTITNASGCSATSAATSVTVNTAPATPAITPSGATTFCEGGSVTLTAPAGYSYQWANGATTQSIAVSASGAYSVTVTNASGCSATSAATNVTVNAAPETPAITPSGSTTFCEGGSVTLTAPAGYSYQWSNGATTQSIAVNASGAYSVTVTNASGCSATSAATNVTVNAAPETPTISASGPTTFCQGGSVTLTAPAGFSYQWSNGATTQSIAVNTSGSNSVTVTNASGCSATSAATTVTVNANPATPAITPNGPTTFCQGGSVTLTAPAGFSYQWSNGATTQAITVNASGSYSVIVTNASGCTATSAATSVTVNANPATPTITPNGPTTFCQGGSVTLTAPAGFSYLWSNGATTQSINVTASGSYNVAVTNASGCSATSAPTTVTVNPLPATPTITPSGSAALCPGSSVTLTAPAGFTAYLWSNGATTQSITVSTAANYTVTVTNANGCQRMSAPVSVTQNPATAITTQPLTQTMSRTETRQLSVIATGTATLQYQWYSGTSGNTSSPLAGQTGSTLNIGPFTKKGTQNYWVRVTSTGCPASSVNSATAVITVTN